MAIIQDEGKRMAAYTHTALSMCDGSCGKCSEDERLYDGLGIKGSTLKNMCPLGLALGKRIEDYTLNNPLKHYIIPAARSLQIDSIRSVNPKKIKRDIRTLGVIFDHSERTPTKVHSPEIPQIAHISSSITKKFTKGLIGLF